MMEEKRLAKIGPVDLVFDDHCTFALRATFDYGNFCQGLGYNVDEEYIRRFIWACGKRSFKACEGTIVLVTIEDGMVRAIEPPGTFQEGTRFDITVWEKDTIARWKILKEHDLLGTPHPDAAGFDA